jgi:hypothetical protein
MGEIMLGLIKLNDFAITLKNRTELDDKIIQGISQDINQSIFQPIMNILPKTSKSFTDNDNVVDLKKTFK